MPKLKEDMTASTVDCSGDSLAAFDLLGGMNAGGRDISLCLGRNLGCFRNDQAGAGALSVVEGVQYLRRVLFPSPAPRERRHENTVLRAQAPSSSGLKRFAIIVRKELHLAWRQRHRPSINQKVHSHFQLLSEFLCRFFPVEDRDSL